MQWQSSSYEINMELTEGVSEMMPEKNGILNALSNVESCHKGENRC